MIIYLIGSLKDLRVRAVAAELRREGHEVFDDWHAAGPEADQHWRRYEMARGRTYRGALCHSIAHETVFALDKRWLDACDAAVAVAPRHKLPGRSGMSELTYVRWGRAKPTFLLLSGDPEDWDQMLPLAVPTTAIFYAIPQLIAALKG